MDIHFLVLALLFTLSNVFWAVVVFKLMNRLMSRNYYEFKVAETLEKKKETRGQQQFHSPMNEDDMMALKSIIPGL